MAVTRNYTMQDLFSALAGNAGENLNLSIQTLNTFINDAETLIIQSTVSPTITLVTDYPVMVAGDYPMNYWRLGDAVASTTAFDSTPGAWATYPKRTGTVTSVVFGGAGPFTNAGSGVFNGSSSNISVANATTLQLAGDMSVEFWLNTASLSANQTVISKGATAEFEVVLHTNGSITYAFRSGSTNNSFTVVPAASITASTWYHVVITRTAATTTVVGYLNGTSVSSNTYSGAITTSTNAVIVGAVSPTPATFFNGALAEVALYAKPLTGTQAASHHTWGTAATAGADAYGLTGTLYGLTPYPAAGAPTQAAWGSAAATWGTTPWV